MEAKRIPVNVPKPPDTVQLTITLEEAQLLRKLLGNIGGETSSWGTTRKYYDLSRGIYQALERAGIETSALGTEFQVINSGRSVRVIDKG